MILDNINKLINERFLGGVSGGPGFVSTYSDGILRSINSDNKKKKELNGVIRVKKSKISNINKR